MNGFVQAIGDLKVLAVDDNMQARVLLRTTLKDLGVNQIFTANDGKEALDFLADCDEMINLIMCDWNMPRVSGLEILRQVRTVNQHVPFMMVTGATDLESVSVAKENGVTCYLAKPYSQNDLEKKLRQVVRIVQVRQEAA